MYTKENYFVLFSSTRENYFVRLYSCFCFNVYLSLPIISCFSFCYFLLSGLSDEGLAPAEVHGTVTLQAVTFAYPMRPDHNVYQGLDLTIEAGSTVALVGPSGCGKSTAVQLIERFYDPDAGAVLLDGVDLKKLRVSWLRQQIGLVSQEPVLFSGSISDNIKYGKEGASQADVEAAARLANAHDFISAFADGYNTQVGEKGVQLSGGQKQRVAIARAIIRDPKVRTK